MDPNKEFTIKLHEYLLSNEIFNINKNYNITLKQHRKLTLDRLKKLLQSNIISKNEIIDDFSKYYTIFKNLQYIDPSFAVKFAVHTGLFASSILNLGTSKHKKYFDELITLKISGMFAMTEIGHGSNVMDIETTAIFKKNSFIINTPTLCARKCWIGNAIDGNTAVVFAQLYVNNVCYGVHSFLVPIRNNNKLCSGITITDCGKKGGLNGVDNGIISFNNVIIPYDNMLDKYGKIEDNKYISYIKNNVKRFSKMLESLTGGRIAITGGSLFISRLCLTIAVKYCLKRRQFRIGKSQENLLIDYTTHQKILIPLLAKTHVFTVTSNYIENLYDKFNKNKFNDIKFVHTLSSGMKILSSHHGFITSIMCRSLCGGNGYSEYNRISSYMHDCDIYQTFEGDNNVLKQQVSQYILNLGKKNVINIQNKLNNISITNNIIKLLEYRVDILTLASINKLQKEFIMSKGNKMKTWNNSLFMTNELAMSYIEYYTVNKYQESKGIDDLSTLVGLIFIENNKDFYLSNGLIKKTYSTTEKINKLCYKLRQNINSLIDQFNIPQQYWNVDMINNITPSKL